MPENKKISEVLGNIRKELITQGFSEQEAYSLVTEILRKAHDLDDLLDASGQF